MSLAAPRQQLRFAPLLTFRSPGYRYLWLASVLWNQARATAVALNAGLCAVLVSLVAARLPGFRAS